MRVKSLMLSICLLVMTGCSSCGGSGTTWTIFVYGHGDHNLTGSLANDINKMTDATLNGNVKVIVAADFNAAVKDASGAAYPTGTTWYEINGNGVKTPIRGEIAEQNLDDPAVLTEAVEFVIKNYPAEHYGIIMWDHGGAWDGGFGGDTQNGTLQGLQVRGMTAVESRDAILQGLKAGSSFKANTLDFVAFDTCLLGAAEVSYLYKDIAKVFIANAEIDFGAGWNYKDTLTGLAANPGMTPTEFATMEIKDWEALHKDASAQDKLIRSHTAIDTSKINDFANTIKDLVTAIQATKVGALLPNSGEVYAKALAFAIPGYGKVEVKKNDTYEYRDLGQFLKYLITNASSDVAAKAQTAFTSLSDMQIGRNYGTLRDPATTYELAFNIALPEISAITTELLSDYAIKAAEWTDATGWKDFLADLKTSTSEDNPAGNFGVVGMVGTMIPSGTALTYGSMQLLQYDFPTSYNYGMTHFGKITSGTTYAMTWDGTIWKLGTEVESTTVLPWSTISNELNTATFYPDNLLAAAAIITDNDGAEYDAYFIFKAGETTANSVAFQSEEGEWAVSSVDDFALEHTGATFQAALMDVSDDSFVAQGTGEDFPSSGGVAITTAAAPSGTYYLMATVQNAWGNSASGTGAVTIP